MRTQAEWQAFTRKHGRKNKTPLLMPLHSHCRQRRRERGGGGGRGGEGERERERERGDENKIQQKSQERERGDRERRERIEEGVWRANGDESKS